MFKDVKYPSILGQEKEQQVNGNKEGKLGLSEQEKLINQENELTATLNVKTTYWEKNMEENNFLDYKYYELFGNKDDKYYDAYFLSSRCIEINSDYIGFYVSRIDKGRIYASIFYSSKGNYNGGNFSLRPIVTLNSNIQLDTTKSGEGTESNPFEIK